MKRKEGTPFPHLISSLPSSHSTKMDGFPAGLRVLVVDDDPTWLKILEKMLKKCYYDVTTCCKAIDALDMLRERRDRFDIVISDVNMPDMDGFKLLEHVGLEMDLPVIMMSVDGETSRVMKGVQHGACDYLLKPIRMKELRNIWQHVFRKKINEVKEIESHEPESFDGCQMMRSGLDDYEDSTKKRKEIGSEEHGDQNFNNHPGAVKKARVIWSVDLHQKFVNAVNQIGFDKVGPKKILDLMNIPGLTRENVASHLQKYRLYLSRLQRQNEMIPSSGITQSGISCKDHLGKHELQSSMKTQHQSPNCFGYSTKQTMGQNVVPEVHEGESRSTVSFLPIVDAKKPPKSDSPTAPSLTNAPQLGGGLPFGSIVPHANRMSYGSTIPEQQSWNADGSAVKLLQHLKQDQKTNLQEQYIGLPHHIQVDGLQTTASTSVGTYMFNTNQTVLPDIKPLYSGIDKSHVGRVSQVAGEQQSFPLQSNHTNTNPQKFGARPVSSASSSTKNHENNRNVVNSWESTQSLSLKNWPFSASSQEDLPLQSFQSYECFENAPLDELDYFCFSDSSSTSELQNYLFDGWRFNNDYQCDSMEYPVMDEGVFIA